MLGHASNKIYQRLGVNYIYSLPFKMCVQSAERQIKINAIFSNKFKKIFQQFIRYQWFFSLIYEGKKS